MQSDLDALIAHAAEEKDGSPIHQILADRLEEAGSPLHEVIRAGMPDRSVGGGPPGTLVYDDTHSHGAYVPGFVDGLHVRIHYPNAGRLGLIAGHELLGGGIAYRWGVYGTPAEIGRRVALLADRPGGSEWQKAVIAEGPRVRSVYNAGYGSDAERWPNVRDWVDLADAAATPMPKQFRRQPRRYAASDDPGIHRAIEQAWDDQQAGTQGDSNLPMVYADSLDDEGLHNIAAHIRLAAREMSWPAFRSEWRRDAYAAPQDLLPRQWGVRAYPTEESGYRAHRLCAVTKNLSGGAGRSGTTSHWSWAAHYPEEQIRDILRGIAADGAVIPEDVRLRYSLPKAPEQMARPGQPRRYSHTDDAAFHNAIGDSQKNRMDFGVDKTPQMVYADHLEETGRPALAHIVRGDASHDVGSVARMDTGGELYRLPDRIQAEAFGVEASQPWENGRHSIVVWERHRGNPNLRLGWSASFGTPEEVMQHLKALQGEGVYVHPYRYANTDYGVESPEPEDGPQQYARSVPYEADEPFLRQIAENPQDPTPILVFADHLEEAGDPRAAVVRAHGRRLQDTGDPMPFGTRRHLTEFLGDVPGSASRKAGDVVAMLYHDGFQFRTPQRRLPVRVSFPAQADQHTPNYFYGDLRPDEARILASSLADQDKDRAHEKLDAWFGKDVGREPRQAARRGPKLRYAAVDESAIHPDWKPDGIAPRLGRALQHIASQEEQYPHSGELATVALALGPEGVGPDHFTKLGEALKQEGHPLGKKYTWHRINQGIALDRRVEGLLRDGGWMERWTPINPDQNHGDNYSLVHRAAHAVRHSPAAFGAALGSRGVPAVHKDVLRSLDRAADRALDRIQHSGAYDDNAALHPISSSRYARKPKTAVSFTSALRLLQSPKQEARREAAWWSAHASGIEPHVFHDALHDHLRGTAPSVVHHWPQAPEPERAHYAAAWFGLLTGLESVGVFYPGQGSDRLTAFTAPKGTSGAELQQQLNQAGIGDRVLIPQDGGFRVLVFDPGGKLTPVIAKFAKEHGYSGLSSATGQGTRLGGAEPRQARAAYRKIIQKFEGKQRKGRRGQPRRYNIDRDALIRAIAENPEERANHGVLADWLEEHGSPLADIVRHPDRIDTRTHQWPSFPLHGLHVTVGYLSDGVMSVRVGVKPFGPRTWRNFFWDRTGTPEETAKKLAGLARLAGQKTARPLVSFIHRNGYDDMPGENWERLSEALDKHRHDQEPEQFRRRYAKFPASQSAGSVWVRVPVPQPVQQAKPVTQPKPQQPVKPAATPTKAASERKAGGAAYVFPLAGVRQKATQKAREGTPRRYAADWGTVGEFAHQSALGRLHGDPAPQMVMADYLEEHGHPLAGVIRHDAEQRLAAGGGEREGDRYVNHGRYNHWAIDGDWAREHGYAGHYQAQGIRNGHVNYYAHATDPDRVLVEANLLHDGMWPHREPGEPFGRVETPAMVAWQEMSKAAASRLAKSLVRHNWHQRGLKSDFRKQQAVSLARFFGWTPERPQRHAKFKAPPGGMISRGLYYPGGEFLPDWDEPEKKSPEQSVESHRGVAHDAPPPTKVFTDPVTGKQFRHDKKARKLVPVAASVPHNRVRSLVAAAPRSGDRKTRYAASDADGMVRSLEAEDLEGGEGADHIKRDIAADALEENGRTEEASLLRSGARLAKVDGKLLQRMTLGEYANSHDWPVLFVTSRSHENGLSVPLGHPDASDFAQRRNLYDYNGYVGGGRWQWDGQGDHLPTDDRGGHIRRFEAAQDPESWQQLVDEYNAA